MFFKLSPKATAAMDKVIAKFKTGDLSPVYQIAALQPDPQDTRPAAAWTLRNQILAYMTTGSLDARGYRQWQNVGRQVIKGETAGVILAPITRKTENENGDEQPVVVGFKGIPVFGLEQTDGEPLPHFDYSPAEPPPLADLATELGVTIEWRADLPPDRLADCSIDGKEIRLGAHAPEIFWHELGHALHTRTNGPRKTKTAEEIAHRETVAEFTATVLAQLYGNDKTGNAWDYIQHFSPNPLAAITAAIDEVSAIIAEIEKIQQGEPA